MSGGSILNICQRPTIRQHGVFRHDGNSVANHDIVGVVAVLGLSLLDALLTLSLLAKGARELNPIMAYYLTHGPRVFLFVKYGLTALSVWLIVLLNVTLAARYRIGGSMVLHIFAACFGSAVIWQLYLLSA